MKDKDYLREKYLKIRKNISNMDRIHIANSILSKIIMLKEYKEAKLICSYMSLEDEVYTHVINKKILEAKKTLALPVVCESNLEFYKVSDLKNIEEISNFGIREPKRVEENLIKENIDLMIIPGICFDEHCNRLGFGKGYYDKYLANLANNTFKIGICYDSQIEREIPVTNMDILMDLVITEKRIIAI